VQPIGLPNPDSAVMGLRLQDRGLLLVFNNSSKSRDGLSLALSRDGGERWLVLHRFEADMRDHHGALENFSYPYVVQSSDGIVHVVYVWRVTHVKHVSFNEAWIRELER
jgi:predicted neuraminidase